MSEDEPKDFIRSSNVSNSFKITLSIVIIIVVGFFAKKIHDQGGDWENLVLGTVFFVPVMFWFMPTMVKLTHQPDKIPPNELKAIESLKTDPLTKQYAEPILRILVVTGYILKWIFFYTFGVGAIMIAVQKEALHDILLVAAISLIWCPWNEKILPKTIRTSHLFLGRAILSAAAMGIGALLSN